MISNIAQRIKGTPAKLNINLKNITLKHLYLQHIKNNNKKIVIIIKNQNDRDTSFTTW